MHTILRSIKIVIVFIFLFISTSNAQQYPIGTWTPKATFMGSARGFASAFSIDTLGYIGLGFDTGLRHDFYKYLPDSDVWHEVDSFPGLSRSSAVSFSNDSAGWGFVGSGYVGANTWDNGYWKYIQSSDTWTQVSTSNVYRSQAVGVAVGTNAYVTTGVDGNTQYNDTYRYDMLSDSWSTDTTFAGAVRNAAAGFRIGNKIYVGTGMSDSMYFNDFWSFNTSTHTWTQEAPFGGTERFGAVGFSVGGFGFIGLGQDLNTSYRQDFWLYDPNLNLWTFVSHFPGTGRKYAVAFTIHDSVAYVGTGIDANGNTNDFWEFAADTTAGINEIKTQLASASIYPNPSNGAFQFNYDLGSITNAELMINDETGKQVANYQLVSNHSTITIDESGLRNGIYYYRIVNNNKSLNSGKICILK